MGKGFQAWRDSTFAQRHVQSTLHIEQDLPENFGSTLNSFRFRVTTSQYADTTVEPVSLHNMSKRQFNLGESPLHPLASPPQTCKWPSRNECCLSDAATIAVESCSQGPVEHP